MNASSKGKLLSRKLLTALLAVSLLLSTILTNVQTTLAAAPTVTISAATVLRNTTATANGNITNLNGGSSCTEWGFEYDDDGTGAPYAYEQHSVGTKGVASFSEVLTGLSTHTLYYIRAYAINDGGTSYSAETTFYTTPDELFWIGGSGNWNGATSWSFTSGGAAAGVNYLPALDTNVFFDANSGFGVGDKTVTQNISNIYMHDMDWTGALNTPIFNSTSTNYAYIYGSLTLIAGLTFTQSAGAWMPSLYGTGAETITCNGATFGDSSSTSIVISPTGGYTLSDDFRCSGDLRVTSGYFDTAGYDIWAGGMQVTGATARTVTLNDSVITLNNNNVGDSSLFWRAGTTTNLVWNAGTSSIIGTYANVGFEGGGLTYYNVTKTGGGATLVKFTGANTFNNLSITGTAVKTDTVIFSANQTITGTLTLNGNSATNRLLVQSDTPATYRTLTVTTAIVASNVDFLDIQGATAGAASWDLSAISGGSGNAGHNAGITFTTADDCFWVENSGDWDDSSHWATTSGGVAGSQRVPLVQDTAIWDENSFYIDSQTVTATGDRIGNFVTTDVTETPQFTIAADCYFYGDIELGNHTMTSAWTWRLYGRGTQTIEALTGMAYGVSAGMYNYGAALQLNSDFEITGGNGLYFNNGMLNLNGFTLITNKFDGDNGEARTLSWNSGTIVINDNGTWDTDPKTNLTMGANDGTLIFDGTATFYPDNLITFNDIIFQGDGVDTLTISGDHFTCNTLTIDRSEAAKTISGAYTITLNTGLSIPVAGATVVTISNTDFSKTSGVVAVDYIAFSGGANTSTAGGGATFFAGTHSTGSPQTGWSFTDPTVPIITNTAATNPALTSITLNGTVDTMGSFTPLYAYWQYGLTATYDGSWTTTAEETVTGVGSYSRDITGINPDTTYNVRMGVRYNINSNVYSAYGTFDSSGAPTVTTGTALVDVGALSAQLDGILTSLGIYDNVLVYFEYGKTMAYGNTTTQQYLTTAPIAFTDTISGLVENTDYVFRAVCLYNGATEYVYGSPVTFSTNIAAATTIPSAILAKRIVVVRNVITDSLVTYDQVYLLHYDIQYDQYPTDYSVREAYIFQLINTTGSLMGSQLAYPYVNKGYGEGIVAFYFAAGSTPTWGGAYTIRITGNPTIFTGTLPSADFVLDSSNYTTLSAHSDTQEFLCTSIFTISESLEQEWQVALLSQQDTGKKLSSNGEAYYRAAIPNIDAMAPCLFFLQSENIDTSKRSWGTSLGDTYKGRLDGTWIKSSLQAAADTINIPLTLVYGVILVVVCVLLLRNSKQKYQSNLPGIVGCLLAIICGGLMVMGFTVVSLIGLALVIVAGWLLFMRRA